GRPARRSDPADGTCAGVRGGRQRDAARPGADRARRAGRPAPPLAAFRDASSSRARVGTRAFWRPRPARAALARVPGDGLAAPGRRPPRMSAAGAAARKRPGNAIVIGVVTLAVLAALWLFAQRERELQRTAVGFAGLVAWLEENG